MKLLRDLLSCLLDVAWPESCWLCAASGARRPLLEPGPPVAGLRPWDRPHLCRRCLANLAGPVQAATIAVPAGPPLQVTAGTATGERLVDLVGGWKYHRVRGLAWPLAQLALPALDRILAAEPVSVSLVPVPLHAARRRERGFNQAEVLARLLSQARGIAVRTDLVERVRATAQQAKIDDPAARARNMRSAFRCAPAADAGPLVLVDDLITSGATMTACAAALRRRGYEVTWLLAIGGARRSPAATVCNRARS